jgi:hypothetical protein
VWLPVTSTILNAKATFEKRGKKNFREGMKTRRTILRDRKKAAAKIRWDRQRERAMAAANPQPDPNEMVDPLGPEPLFVMCSDQEEAEHIASIVGHDHNYYQKEEPEECSQSSWMPTGSDVELMETDDCDNVKDDGLIEFFETHHE